MRPGRRRERVVRFPAMMLPFATPGLATLVVFQFIYTWNQFAMPLSSSRMTSCGQFHSARFSSSAGSLRTGE